MSCQEQPESLLADRSEYPVKLLDPLDPRR